MAPSDTMKTDVLDQLIALLSETCQRMIERDERLRLERRGELPATEEPPSEALHRLKLGEITAAEYLDIKVEAAMARLQCLLPDDDYLYVKALIRDRIETDPLLMALVQRLISGNGARRPYN